MAVHCSLCDTVWKPLKHTEGHLVTFSITMYNNVRLITISRDKNNYKKAKLSIIQAFEIGKNILQETKYQLFIELFKVVAFLTKKTISF